MLCNCAALPMASADFMTAHTLCCIRVTCLSLPSASPGIYFAKEIQSNLDLTLPKLIRACMQRCLPLSHYAALLGLVSFHADHCPYCCCSLQNWIAARECKASKDSRIFLSGLLCSQLVTPTISLRRPLARSTSFAGFPALSTPSAAPTAAASSLPGFLCSGLA